MSQKAEFPHLFEGTDGARTVYLDQAGAALPARSLLKACYDDIMKSPVANPHTCSHTRDRISHVRDCILCELFATSSATHAVVFTSGATEAIRKVAQGLVTAVKKVVYLDECHTSVVGTRKLFPADVPVQAVSRKNIDTLELPREDASLVILPAMSNFCGTKFPIGKWVAYLKREYPKCLILLDAAAWVSTAPLDVSDYPLSLVDFISVSFYKVFGYPTGLGAIIIRQDSVDAIKKTYFGGGTVSMHLVQSFEHVLRRGSPDEWLEDGTSHFLGILALKHGLDVLKTFGGLSAIRDASFCIAKYCYQEMKKLHHSNGQALVQFNTLEDFSSIDCQGPIVNFNLLNETGGKLGFMPFKKLAETRNIVFRAGCFCNIGACQKYLGYTDQDQRGFYARGHVCGDDVDLIDGKPVGSIRLSFGVYNRRDDVDIIVKLLQDFYLRKATPDTKISDSSSSILIDKLFVYPVKSCAPYEVEKWPLQRSGLYLDRHWAIMKGKQCLTQKKVPALCLIQPRLDLATGTLTLTYPGLTESLCISISKTSNSSTKQLCLGKVCGEQIETFDCGGSQATKWLEEALGEPELKLVRLLKRKMRNQNNTDSTSMSMANDGQLLVLNRSTCQTISEKLDNSSLPWVINQFRGNIVLSGTLPYSEEHWHTLQIAPSVTLTRLRLCQRCEMIGIDQQTAYQHPDIIKVISEEAVRRSQKYAIGVLYKLEEKSDVEEIFVGQAVKLSRKLP